MKEKSSSRAAGPAAASDALIETCRQGAISLLRKNLSPQGILAATPHPRAEQRGYVAIFGRDAAVCAIGMALSGDPVLEQEAATGLLTLAEHQAGNGQIPKFVDVRSREADFWYLGCIDATLWWLIALDFLERRGTARGLRRRLAPRIAKALQWLEAQEHQRFFLLQQNEASDWADIMPRSGYQSVVQPALEHQADVALAAFEYLIERMFGDALGEVLARRRQAHVRLQFLLPEDCGRMREPVVDELRRWPVEPVARRHCRRAVFPGDEAAVHVAGADAQFHQVYSMLPTVRSRVRPCRRSSRGSHACAASCGSPRPWPA